MYFKDKIILFIVSCISLVSSWLWKFDYADIASDSMTIISIALAVYMTIFSSLMSSELADKMKKTKDNYFKEKTEMGVLQTYLKNAIYVGCINILLSCGVLIIESKKINQYIYLFISSIGITTLVCNIYFMYLMYKFMINRQLWGK